MQSTSHILMIRPARFSANPETSADNAFQQPVNDPQAHAKALMEFDGLVRLLERNGVNVVVLNDTSKPHTPDSIFPNNWITFHSNGTVCLYPMFAPSRRLERKPHIIEQIRYEYKVRKVLNLTENEKSERFLEGTGSMVLDREEHIAYACLSNRTHKGLFEEFCDRMGYRPLSFHATDLRGMPVYHTNVMMCLADRYAVVCLDAVQDAKERDALSNSLRMSGKKLIPITLEQMDRFAGNMLQVCNQEQRTMLVMSTTAYEALTEEQLEQLSELDRILHTSLETIESHGGGSARCMMAEIFLPLR